MKKPQVVLNNWAVMGESDPYKAPEQFGPRLSGDVLGHPKHDDGKHVTTSPLVRRLAVRNTGTNILPLRDGMIVETANTYYKLDGVDPKYKAWCDVRAYDVMS